VRHVTALISRPNALRNLRGRESRGEESASRLRDRERVESDDREIVTLRG